MAMGSFGGILPLGDTGQHPRTSVVEMTGGAPGIEWVGTRGAVQLSLVPRKATNGSAAQEGRLRHQSQLVPQLGSAWRTGAHGFFTAAGKAVDRPCKPSEGLGPQDSRWWGSLLGRGSTRWAHSS